MAAGGTSVAGVSANVSSFPANVTMNGVMDSPKPQMKRTHGDIVLSLENCLLPAERLDGTTPSVQDGVDPETEAQLRFVGCEMVQTAGTLLRLPQVSTTTANFLAAWFYNF